MAAEDKSRIINRPSTCTEEEATVLPVRQEDATDLPSTLHVTREQTTTNPEPPFEQLEFNRSYLQTIPSLFQLIECVLSAIIFIRVVNIHDAGYVIVVVETVSLFALVHTLAFLALRSFGLDDLTTVKVHWGSVRFLYCCVIFWAYLLVVGLVMCFSIGYIEVAVLAVLSSVVYGFDTTLLIRLLKKRHKEMSGPAEAAASLNGDNARMQLAEPQPELSQA